MERVFLGGAAFEVAAAAAWVIAIFATASDPLFVLALWVPGVMFVSTWVHVTIWAAVSPCLTRRRRQWAMANAVVSWGLGAVYVMVLLFMCVAR